MTQMIIGGIVIVLLIYLIVQRIENEKKEDFDQRDN